MLLAVRQVDVLGPLEVQTANRERLSCRGERKMHTTEEARFCRIILYYNVDIFLIENFNFTICRTNPQDSAL
jgi:hypothetical protein